MLSLFNAAGSTDYCIYEMYLKNQQIHFILWCIFMYNIFTNTFRPVIRSSSCWCVWYIKNITLKMAGLLAETCWWRYYT